MENKRSKHESEAKNDKAGRDDQSQQKDKEQWIALLNKQGCNNRNRNTISRDSGGEQRNG
jgi:hypothetical protein